MQVMTPQRRERIAAGVDKTWSGFLYIIPAAVAFVAIFIVHSARTNSAAIGQDKAFEIAHRTAAAIDGYIMHLSMELRAIAAIPQLVRLTTGAASGPAAAPLRSETEEYLARLTGAKGSVFRELLVADIHGRRVAASGRTEDEDQTDEPWWYQGKELPFACEPDALLTCAYGDDVDIDPSVGGRGAALAVPVFSQGNVAGVLKAVVNPREIDTLLTLAAAKHPIDVLLIRRDGSDALKEPKRDAGAAVPDALATLTPGQEAAFDLNGRRLRTRALAGPHGRLWAVAVRDRTEQRANRTQLMALALIVLVLFLLSARAYALLFHRTQ